MLYHLFEYLEQTYSIPGAGLFRFISFRAGVAILISLTISMFFGKHIIAFLQRKQVGESIRDLGLEGQQEKAGTPTMGGVIIILAIVVPCLLMARLDNIYIILMLLATVWMAIVGFADDYIKVFRKNKAGLHGKFKVMGQVGLGILIGTFMMWHQGIVVQMDREVALAEKLTIVKELPPADDATIPAQVHVKTTLTNVPFLKGNRLDYRLFIQFFGNNADRLAWIIFIPLCIFIITAVSNGANLTDGIDGLATGVSAIIGGTLGLMAYLSGNAIFANYLQILYLPNISELVIFSGCFVGGCVGFLWYNAYPAKVFMGDTGSLTIGGIIASLAILLRKELLIPVLCGVFVAELLSVMIQVGYFKYTRKKYGEGKRIFLMSPLHHHFQKQGMAEPKIVTRFWIVGILLAILTVITLKIR
ncbi:MAG: phospho-N-acetylmuramoyl-pentapeptide-transferase [Saprospiraceae bacterium]|nr:phospho-N-acetylmuramoyl-pentapeptide-transferase [Saprospiraceae bacterium]